MADSASIVSSPGAGAGVFATTRWTLVLATQGDDPAAQDALGRLCQLYWLPLYCYVRRRGQSPEDAQDLTQEFFSRLLARNWFGGADRTKGRFRSYLLGTMNHFLADEWERARAQKRGGGIAHLPLEFGDAETQYMRLPADHATPGQHYERRWAVALLEAVLGRLREEYAREGRAELFASLHPCLVGDRTAQPYAELATRLGVSEGTIKSAVFRLRQRYRELLRAEIAGTVGDETEVEAELRHLFTVLARE